MRVIKFRCFYEGKMYPVLELHGEDGMTVNGLRMELDGLGLRHVSPDQEHIDALMQFTGLCDKRGREIYEGDIVKWDDGSNGKYWRVAIVYWDEYECLHCFKCVTNKLHPLSTENGYVFGGNFANRDKESAARNLILVGNIYEHHELL